MHVSAIMRHDHPLHRKAICGGRSEPRAPLEEVARGVFSGKAFKGVHVVTIHGGGVGEQCELRVDGRLVTAKSYRRCLAAMMARMMREAGITKGKMSGQSVGRKMGG
jgi:hypothetical protein